jgi:hypothetical protein
MKSYTLQLLLALKVSDKVIHYSFCCEMREGLPDDGFAERFIFCDEVAFHISGKIVCHSVHVWGFENPKVACEHERSSARVSVFCDIPAKKLWTILLNQTNSHWGALPGYVDKLAGASAS